MNWLSTVVVLVVLGSCASETETSGEDPEALWGESFVSTGVIRDGAPWPLVPETEIRVSFEERGALGFDAGCNLYGADLEVTAERLMVGPIMGTEMACPGGRDEQDTWLAAFFDADPRWELSDDHALTLTSNRTIVALEPAG